MNNVVNIKGTMNGLVIILDTTKNFAELKTGLEAKITEKRGFFKGASFTFDNATGFLDDTQTEELEALCRQHGLVPKVAVQEQLAKEQTEKNVLSGENLPLQGISPRELAEHTRLLHQGLRSGQKVHYDGNVVILGDVNPGAEIVTTGSIVVMGTLRGIAHAGASGDLSATIQAYSLRPTQLRIAHLIGRSPDDDAQKNKMWPERAQIVNNAIVIEDVYPNKTKKAL